MSSLQTIVEDVQKLVYDEARVQDRLLSHVQQVYDGRIDLVDPSNPFIHAHEAIAVTVSALARREDVLLAKQYPILAKTMDDLYLHMTDRDYLGRFATPSHLTFELVLRRDEIIAKAVRVGDTAVRKLRIPRYTSVMAAGIEYTLLYPIEIRVMSHGGLRVVYDVDEKSPIQNIESNVLEWYTSKISGLDYVYIRLPLMQVTRHEFTETINPATGFKKTFTFDPQFYYARAFGLRTNGTRIEYGISYSEQVFDARSPTIVLKNHEGHVEAEIPYVFFTAGNVPTKLQLDIYTTRGELVMDYSEFDISAFNIRWGKELNPTESVYVSPMLVLDNLNIYSTSQTVGGSHGVTFDELKQRVIQRASAVTLPITDAQLKAALNIRGYGIIKSIDDITRRVYLATRTLPPPTQSIAADGGVEDTRSGLYTTGAACAMETVQVNLIQLVALGNVIDNGPRVTIDPNMRYRYKDGLAKPIPVAEYPENIATSDDHLVTLINSGTYAYSPFHYVLDTTSNRFAVRPYYLQKPKLTQRTFLNENDTTQLSVTTRGIAIERVDTGYQIILTTIVGRTYSELPFDDVFAQLRFKPVNEPTYAVLNGVFEGVINDEYVWRFNINSRFDIDRKHRIGITNFTMFDLEPRVFLAELEHDFELIYGVYNYNVAGLEASPIDLDLGRWLLQDLERVALSKERLRFQLGINLTNLWANARTIAGSRVPLLHQTDVPKTYTETVYETDPVTGVIKLSIVDGELQYNRLHRKGDVVTIGGEIQYLHRKGDVVIDSATGEPVYAEGRSTERLVDIFLIDGAYIYSTNRFDIRYREGIAQTVIGYSNEDIRNLSTETLENTWLYFYPRRNLGYTKALIGSGLESTFDARLSFTIRYYLTVENYTDLELRRSITETTSRVINRTLQRTTVSTELIAQQLRQEIGDDVVSIEIDPIPVAGGITTYTSLNDSTSCSVKRILRVLPNGEKIIDEDITVEWIRHK